MKSLIFSLLLFFNISGFSNFIVNQRDFLPYKDREDVIVIASPGRSASTLLTDTIQQYAADRLVLKTHQFVPYGFRGKILFVFSNPDLIAESALHLVFLDGPRGKIHFTYVFSADWKWGERLSWDFEKQTIENNLLSYDALGIGIHLEKWLLSGVECASEDDAQILAIKYENLWDPETQKALAQFCSFSEWQMPSKRSRGYSRLELNSKELIFRKIYNKGTLENPRYEAYDFARAIWENAHPFQFLKLKK